MEKQLSSVFVGSSLEGLDIAREVELHLDSEASVTIWKSGIFDLGQGALDSLVKALDQFDFAVIILTPDDLLESRGQSYSSPRDNILFELGLFMGRLGPRRTLILHEENAELKLPSDLAGITRALYRKRDNLSAAVSPACTKIIRTIRGLGTFQGRQESLSDLSSRSYMTVASMNDLGHGITLGGTFDSIALEVITSNWTPFHNDSIAKSGWLFAPPLMSSVAVTFFKIHLQNDGTGYIHLVDVSSPSHTIWLSTQVGTRQEAEFDYANHSTDRWNFIWKTAI